MLPALFTFLKLPWADVKKEMTEEKGLDPAVADKIGEYVMYKGICLPCGYRSDSDGDTRQRGALGTVIGRYQAHCKPERQARPCGYGTLIRAPGYLSSYE